MRPSRLIPVIVLAAAAAAPLIADAEPPKPPAMRIEPGAAPLSYELAMVVDPAQETFTGRVGIDLELQRPTGLLWLHAHDLEIAGASLTLADGAEINVTVVEGDENFTGFAFDPGAGPGKGRLDISYTGRFVEGDSIGLFRQQDGEHWYAYTHLEATEARRLVPSFDEPAFKVPWLVTIDAPPGTVAVANTPLTATEPLPDGWQRHRFAASKPLPTYLLAFAVGPFELVDAGSSGDAPLRIVTMAGKADRARFAAEITSELLAIEEEYFGMPYPYAKLDSIAVPQTVSFGAMENPGLITYVERYLLATPAEETLEFQRLHADVAAHELAHQWFGNLVTLAWWDDLWLNEAFADWLGSKAMEQWRPEWEFAISRVASRARAIAVDSLDSARRIRQPIETHHDIFSAFDSISYRKGAAVLVMFEQWLGEERFRNGVRAYLKANAHGVATSADFLAALEKAGGDGVSAAFSSFLDQSGVPELSAELVCDGDGPPRLELAQKRFLPVGSKGSTDRRWSLPVCARWGGDGESSRGCTLLAEGTGSLALTGIRSCPAWVLANEGGSGYYVTRYSDDLLGSLLDAGAAHLTVAERLALLRDIEVMSDGARLPMDLALAAAERFASEPSRHLVGAAARIVEGIDNHLVDDEQRAAYAAYVRDLFAARARRLGFEPRPGESDDDSLLREDLLALVADQGADSELRAEARRLATAWLEDHAAVSAEVAGTVLRIAALDGDEELLERYVAAVKTEPERADRERLFRALASFRDLKLARRAQELFLSDDFDPLEAGRLFRSGDHPPTDRMRWEFFRDHFDAISQKLPPEYMAFMIYLGAPFCTPDERAEVAAFLSPRVDAIPGGPRNLAQTLEIVELCVAARDVQAPRVTEFLAGR